MPKGQGRKDNSGGGQIAAPQAAAHRRGGTHRVKDEHKTNTIYDEWDYKQLKAESIERGVYIKDMKKLEMARALAGFDLKKKQAEQAANQDRENKQRQQAKEKQREEEKRWRMVAAKHRRRIKKQARRDRDEEVSDDTPDEEELQKMHNQMLVLEDDGADRGPVGQALSDDSWDSTSSESSGHSDASSIEPECRLRLLEWPYVNMPPSTKPSTPVSLLRHSNGRLKPEQKPSKIAYLPLKIHTTGSKEKMFLPGQTYPPGVDADFVPILSQQTRDAARNGVLEGVLRKATIESASAWTDRTLIQGWNAHMYFSPAPRNTTKALPDVYNKWYLENRRLLRVKPVGDGDRVSRDKRHAQRHKNKAKELAEILESSAHRPTAIGYVAAYLDFNSDETVMRKRQKKEVHTLENLFFIRFPGCDAPHYYFWTRKGEWSDPTEPNPAWDPTSIEDDHEPSSSDEEMDRSQFAGKQQPVLTRVKKVGVSASHTVYPDALSTITSRVEHELCTLGLPTILAGYLNKWLNNGKADAWRTFGRQLPMLYPSGSLPTAPPVHANGDISIATKVASIEVLGSKTLLSPYRGDEPWTRDDDAFWDVVDEMGVVVPRDSLPTPPAKIESLILPAESDDLYRRCSTIAHPLSPAEFETLYRRCSSIANPLLPAGVEALYRHGSSLSTLPFNTTAWLDQLSPSFAPLTANTLTPDIPTEQVSDLVRQEWESRFLSPEQKGMNVVCPFCLADLQRRSFQGQVEHMYGHSNIAVPRRWSSVYPLVALPPASRRPSAVKTDGFDLGAEADSEKTPVLPSKRTRRSKKVTKRRVSELTFHPPASASTHIPSPYLPTIKRYSASHPAASVNPRKRSISSVESLEFLDDFEGRKKRKVGEVVLKVCPHHLRFSLPA